MNDDTVIVKLTDIEKYYGDIHALKGISLEVKKGEIFGYLGPNGSGKTTTIKLILGLNQPSFGQIAVFGNDPYPSTKDNLQNRFRIGFMLEFDGLYEKLTGLENLLFWASLYNINKEIAYQKANELLQQVKLDERKDDIVKNYSYGMKKRLALIRALLVEPELLVLDEPTLGVDPESRYIIRDIIKFLANEGKTIFFSSHDLVEVQKICSQIAIISNGKIILKDSLNNIINVPGPVEVTLEEAYMKVVTGDFL